MSNYNSGSKINDMINDAINSMNFDNVSRYINSTFKEFVYGRPEDIKVNPTGPNFQTGGFNAGGQQNAGAGFNAGGPYNAGTQQNAGPQFNTGNKFHVNPYSPNSGVPATVKPAGTYSGPVMMVCGIIGIVTFGAGSLMSLGVGALLSVNMAVWSISSGCCAAACAFLTAKGAGIRKRIKRFREYLSIMRGAEFYDIGDLAEKIGKKKDFVKADLNKMISMRMFPEGHIDEAGKFFITNNATYEKYMAAKESFDERRRQTEADAQKRAGESAEERKLREVLEKGRESIEQIRSANVALTDEEISRKLDEIEKLVTQIFKRVEEKPALLGDIKKFMDYYLPTTVKLVEVYTDFENKPIQTDEIVKAKEEIEQTLDTITVAFRKLLSELYEDTVMGRRRCLC